MNDITSYMLEQTKKILSIDSPTGFTAHAAEYVLGAYKKLGYDAKLTNKGGIFVCVNDGPDQADDPADAPILLEAHMDTLGGMVCSINEKGRLMLSALGGMNPNNAEAENCRVYTRSGKVYSGTFQLKNASIHVNGSYNDTARSYDAMEVVLDEPVESKADTEALGIMTGDIVCFGYGLRRRWPFLQRNPGFHLRKGFRRSLSLRCCFCTDRGSAHRQC